MYNMENNILLRESLNDANKSFPIFHIQKKRIIFPNLPDSSLSKVVADSGMRIMPPDVESTTSKTLINKSMHFSYD